MAKYINPYTDFGFKKLFGEEANKDLLLDFLNQLLPPHHQIADLHFKNVENLPEQRDEYEQSRMSYIELKEVANTATMEGRKKRELEIAKELKKNLVPKEIIKSSTGLSDEEIDRL